MIRRPPRSTLDRSSAASDVYKRQPLSPEVQCLTHRESVAESVKKVLVELHRKGYIDLSGDAGVSMEDKGAHAGCEPPSGLFRG